MAKPATREQLKDYCLRRLGFPVIDINVDDDQVDDRIDDALTKFAEFHFDGVHRDYVMHLMTEEDYTNKYITLPDSIIGVNRIFGIGSDSVGSNGTNFNMFDINYQLRLNELYDFTNSSYMYYWIARTHLSMLDQLLVGQNPIRFTKTMNKLYVDMNWAGEEVKVGNYMAIDCYSVVEANTYTDIFHDSWLKDYTTQLIKKQWGENMKKYGNYTLPGGMVINAQTIYDEATNEIVRLEQQLRDTYEEPPDFLVG